MPSLLNEQFSQFNSDESGFIISAELILIATLLVIGLIVGLSEIQHAVNGELNDVGEAIGNSNQSYFYSGFFAEKDDFNDLNEIKSVSEGSSFLDNEDDCDNNECQIDCADPVAETPKTF